jgi:ATP-binding cassette, subfamily F, member 3
LIQIAGDDTTALESVLKADVWRDHLLKQEAELNKKLAELEEGDDRATDEAREELSGRLGEVHSRLADMDAASGPARAGLLLAGRSADLCGDNCLLTFSLGLGFSEADQKLPTKSFSGGWRYA